MNNIGTAALLEDEQKKQRDGEADGSADSDAVALYSDAAADAEGGRAVDGTAGAHAAAIAERRCQSCQGEHHAPQVACEAARLAGELAIKPALVVAQERQTMDGETVRIMLACKFQTSKMARQAFTSTPGFTPVC